jgi:hypothetical protein
VEQTPISGQDTSRRGYSRPEIERPEIEVTLAPQGPRQTAQTTPFQNENQHLPRPWNARGSNHPHGVCNDAVCFLHESTCAVGGVGWLVLSGAATAPGRSVRRWGPVRWTRRVVLRLALPVENSQSGQDARLWSSRSSASARPLERILLLLSPTSAVPLLPRLADSLPLSAPRSRLARKTPAPLRAASKC